MPAPQRGAEAWPWPSRRPSLVAFQAVAALPAQAAAAPAAAAPAAQAAVALAAWAALALAAQAVAAYMAQVAAFLRAAEVQGQAEQKPQLVERAAALAGFTMVV